MALRVGRWLGVVVLLVGCGARSGVRTPAPMSTDGGIPCVDLPLDDGPISVAIEADTHVQSADVVLLLDVTASMREEIAQIQSTLTRDVIPAIRADIPDTEVGVASFSDFPVSPHGAPMDTPFALATAVTADLTAVQRAVDNLPVQNGLDDPEADVEALYQLATGEGIGLYVPAAMPCERGGVGYACFRPDTQHLVLLFTDEIFRNNADGGEPYAPVLSPVPHTYVQMRDALAAAGIHVLGFDSGDGVATPDLRTLAEDTGAVDASGAPFVYDIGSDGKGLDTQVVAAIRGYVEDIRFDIHAEVRDPDPDDGVDVTALVKGIVPTRAVPRSGIQGIDDATGTFLGVATGTNLSFALKLQKGAVVPTVRPQRFALTVLLVDSAGAVVGQREVTVVIPGAKGEGCDSLP